MRGRSVGRLVRESQATNMLLVNKWLYVILGRYGGFRRSSLLFFARFFSFPSLRPIVLSFSRYLAAWPNAKRPDGYLRTIYDTRDVRTSRYKTLSARPCIIQCNK